MYYLVKHYPYNFVRAFAPLPFKLPSGYTELPYISGTGHQYIDTGIVAKNNIAAWPESDEAEILSVTDGKVTVQGTGKTQVFVARGGKISEHTLDFTNNNAVEIKI